jgi:hypothetical protein
VSIAQYPIGAPRPSAQHQGLEDVLQRLEDHLDSYEIIGEGEVPQVCLTCWSIMSDRTCRCVPSRYWPITHAVGRLRAILGIEGYI